MLTGVPNGTGVHGTRLLCLVSVAICPSPSRSSSGQHSVTLNLWVPSVHRVFSFGCVEYLLCKSLGLDYVVCLILKSYSY